MTKRKYELCIYSCSRVAFTLGSLYHVCVILIADLHQLYDNIDTCIVYVWAFLVINRLVSF